MMQDVGEVMVVHLKKNPRLTVGFKSRCANPLSCMKDRPSKTWEVICRTSFSNNGSER